MVFVAEQMSLAECSVSDRVYYLRTDEAVLPVTSVLLACVSLASNQEMDTMSIGLFLTWVNVLVQRSVR